MFRRVACGISGGVDSAVSAFLLKQRGFEVTGIFMKNWDVRDETGKCQSDADKEDAEYVCKHLDIPFKEVNFVKEYWNEVFSEFLQVYTTGQTPNPDVLCNKRIKFGAFYDYAIDHCGLDAIAMGHYAKNSAGTYLENFNPEKGSKLLIPKDWRKDQTLFLSQIPQRALQRTMFPLGDLEKSKVKHIAVECGLEKIAKRRESMGICFIGKRRFDSFIEEYIEPKPGKFINIEDGEVIGSHEGIHYWTIGQCIRLGGAKHSFYVTKINATTRDVFVAPGFGHPSLFHTSVYTVKPHWILAAPEELYRTKEYHCGFRCQNCMPIIPCILNLRDDGGIKVTLQDPVRAMTPGQDAVFYKNDEVLGGARLSEVGPSYYELGLEVDPTNTTTWGQSRPREAKHA